MKKVMIIDDDLTFLKLTSRFLKKSGYQVVVFQDWDTALPKFNGSDSFDLLIVDLFLQDISGIDIIKEVRKIDTDIPILMITAHSSIQTAIEAVKAGAEDYIQKPCENTEILFKIQRIFENSEKEKELLRLKETISGQYRFENLLTRDEETKKVYQMSETASQMDVTIFLHGETGTGKEMLARAIHSSSSRKDKQWVVVNCAALNENLIESELFGHKKGSFTSAFADKEGRCQSVQDGTLFIDEVGELSLQTQKKLLRLLQEKEFEPIGSNRTIKFRGRIIVASHRDLRDMINQGKFRKDLFYRINVFPIFLKPLRSRSHDIQDLGELFIKKYSNKYGKKVFQIAPDTLAKMMEYSWPGNIRELEHFIERQVLLAKNESIDIGDEAIEGDGEESSLFQDKLSDEKNGSVEVQPFNEHMKVQEKEYIMALLTRCQGSMEEAAKQASIHRKTLYMKMRDYGIDKKDFKPE